MLTQQIATNLINLNHNTTHYWLDYSDGLDSVKLQRFTNQELINKFLPRVLAKDGTMQPKYFYDEKSSALYEMLPHIDNFYLVVEDCTKHEALYFLCKEAMENADENCAITIISNRQNMINYINCWLNDTLAWFPSDNEYKKQVKSIVDSLKKIQKNKDREKRRKQKQQCDNSSFLDVETQNNVIVVDECITIENVQTNNLVVTEVIKSEVNLNDNNDLNSKNVVNKDKIVNLDNKSKKPTSKNKTANNKKMSKNDTKNKLVENKENKKHLNVNNLLQKPPIPISKLLQNKSQ